MNILNRVRRGWTNLTSLFTGSNVDEQTEPVEPFVNSDPGKSSPDDCISEEVECSKRLADAVQEKSEELKPVGSLSVYKIFLTDEHINIKGCKRFTFGKEATKPNRTIMVLGATGAGKSTLINGMINYMLGVQWKDSYRFKLVNEGQSKSQAHSQTSEVTAYRINHQEGFNIDHSLTIIDTPGFGDTRGIERDREIVEQLRNLFSDQRGVTEIDAVCFVVQSALARLTPSQKYVFDSVLSVFGKDVAENIRILVTFADGQRPPVLEAINESGVPCPKTDDGLPVHFKFNNSALFANNKSPVTDNTGDDDDVGFDEMFWNMGTKSMKKFFAALNVIKTKSLTLTQEVLRERKQLEVSVENLQKQVKLGLAKLEEINETTEKLKDHEAEINRNEKFEIETTVTKPFQHDISGTGTYITNCQQCHYTCHHPCGIPDDAKKMYCVAMTDGYCIWCPNKCIWSVHFNQKYKWEYKQVTEKQTLEDLKEKFLKARGKKMTVQGVIDGMKAEYDDLKSEVVKLIDRSAKCLNRLKEIALKPNPLSTPDYIDMLIEGEKSEAKPGWKKRVNSLMTVRERAEYMVKVEKGESFLQSSDTHLQHYNQGQTKSGGNKDNCAKTVQAKIKVDQDEATSNADQDETSNADQDETASNAAQDETSNAAQDETSNADQDKTRSNAAQDETTSNAAQDETTSNADQDKTTSNADQDETSNADQDETASNADQDKTTSNADQDKTTSNADQDKTTSNADQDKTTSNADQDKTTSNADQDKTSNADQDEMSNADQDETTSNAAQDETTSNADQDETASNADQDETASNADQDETASNADQDETASNADQDKTTSNADQDKTSNTDQDETSNADQDETTSNADQDKTSNADQDEMSNADQDETTSNAAQDETTSSADQDETASSADQDETTSSADQDETASSADQDETTSNAD